MLQLTPEAIDRLKRDMTEFASEGDYFRITAYFIGKRRQIKFDFDNCPQENDFILDFDVLKVILDPCTAEELKNCVFEHGSSGYRLLRNASNC
jgi:Fe-S cluster assembly iron-binding protein IscA